MTTARATGRIAYQGEPGSNSHLVCTEAYPDWEAVACASFEDVFAAVETHQADLALIPIDNSLAGRVADIHHFLPTSQLHIIGEHFLRIRFALMALPGATAQTIKTVHSHVHALGQCRRIIREHGLQPVISGDTAGRGARGRRGRRPDAGGDRSPAGRRHLRPGDPRRRRRGRGPQHHPLRRPLPRLRQRTPGRRAGRHRFVFNVRNLPAALYKALGGFATNGVNMTKLESYMVGGHFAATQFLAEVDGHPDDDGVRRALEELEFFTTDVRILGVYPADPERRE